MSSTILEKISIKNFRSFRNKTEFPLKNASYLIGANNAGKSTVLHAIRFFFDDELYENRDFLNKTLVGRRIAGSNICSIAITFNVGSIRKKKLRDKLASSYGEKLTVTKRVKLTDAGVLSFSYSVNNSPEMSSADSGEEVRELINGIKINYLHPQRGEALLSEAQAKLKRRLLDNFGRGTGQIVTKHLKNFDGDWEKLRASASEYLSLGLQSYVEKIWPDGNVTVSLPKDIKDLLEVSDISFSGFKGEPPIELLSHGSGAQALILYFTHFLLDIDKTQSRNAFHQPIWLLEEPESFLHADLCLKLGDQLSSEEWLENIQLLAATHSPILLSRTRLRADKILWSVLKDDEKPKHISPEDASRGEIQEIGRLLGDGNFEYYFDASASDIELLAEDSREETIDVFVRSGLNVVKSTNGVTNFKGIIKSLEGIGEEALRHPKIAILDKDHGFKEVKHLLNKTNLKEKNGFKLYSAKHVKNAYVISLPEGCTAEDLMSELDGELDVVVNQIYDENMMLLHAIPTQFSDLVSKKLRGRKMKRDEAKTVIKSSYDFKSYFWFKMNEAKAVMEQSSSESIKNLINVINK